MSCHEVRVIGPGDTYGRWTVLEYVDHRTVRCVCACGSEKLVESTNLRAGASKSCGCLRWSLQATHLESRRSREYSAWSNMIQRCTNARATKYADYGGRGIAVCIQWLESYETFLRDVGRCPPRHTLDRRDNDGNYEPGNVRWASRTSQVRNRRPSTESKVRFRGVQLSATPGKFVASITVDYKTKHLGTFCTLDEALVARLSAEERLFCPPHETTETT